MPSGRGAHWVGQYISDALNGNAQHINNTREQFNGVASRACPTLTAHEKEQLNKELDVTSLKVLRLPGIDPTFSVQWSDNRICP